MTGSKSNFAYFGALKKYKTVKIRIRLNDVLSTMGEVGVNIFHVRFNWQIFLRVDFLPKVSQISET